MLGSSQQAGGCKKVVRKRIYTIVLLTIAAVTGATGNSRVSVTVGDSSVLTCPLKGSMLMLTWITSPKAGGPCSLVYRADRNTTEGNCSDNINLTFRPGLAPALEIRQAGIAQEGNFTSEMASVEGVFHMTYHLTVLAPPRPSLYCDEQGSPVCEAAAGKPPAQLSWVPESSSTAEEKGHDNGTVTVLSRFTAGSTGGTNMTNMTNVTTCMVFHPAGNWSQSIAHCSPEKTNFFLYACIIPCVLIVIILMAVIYYFKLLSDRSCHKTKPPEIAATHSQQDDAMEVEPYTTYVQKENVIYNSVSDLTVGQNLPQGLCT